MPQAASIQPTLLNICRARITRLTSAGDVAAGPKNSYVTGNIDHINFTPVVNTGVQRVLVGGCNCVKATFKAPDSLLYFTFEYAANALEPEALEMMTGGDAILDTSTLPVAVGYRFPKPIDCGSDASYVALEGWSDNWISGGQAASPFRYSHWIWPMVSWMWGNGSLNNDFMQPTLNGTSRANVAWGVGPYGDLSAAAVAAGGVGDRPAAVFYTDTLPAVTNDYATASSG